MSTTKEYKEFILEQLEFCGSITCRPMMGEYLLYCDGILFGGIYDNRLLIKITNACEKYGMSEQIPYDGAKPMYMPQDTENKELLKNIILDTCTALPVKKKKH